MKSQQSGKSNLLNTSCKECVLAIYEGKTQTGCVANRIEKFKDDVIEAYDDEKEFYVINRLCNFYREDKEKYIKYGKVQLCKIETEAQVSFDVFVQCDQMDNDFRNKILDLYMTTISQYEESKIDLHLMFTNLDKAQKETLHKLRSYINMPKMSMYKDEFFIHNLLCKTSRSYHIFVMKDNIPDNNFISNVNDLVNNDLKKAIVVEHNNSFAISNLAYKVESINIGRNYKDIVNHIIEVSKDMNLYYKL